MFPDPRETVAALGTLVRLEREYPAIGQWQWLVLALFGRKYRGIIPDHPDYCFPNSPPVDSNYK